MAIDVEFPLGLLAEGQYDDTMLGVLLALAIFVTFCDAQCTFTPLEISGGYAPRGCRDSKGVMHDFDTQWEIDCVYCLCESRVGLSCCNMVRRPTTYDKKNCMEVFDKDYCLYIPVLRASPSVPCEVSLYVG
ncbi:beta-microseminoprotein-like [Trichosurus vulpecula]|uniref:beta-microseminoprotein-like n=1 Tax=Trichosurus vulpecula TaxID=9337 RepID=UPI00186B506F|nr:beta-microseminoprotein-like [Trichosurus vulpecula]